MPLLLSEWFLPDFFNVCSIGQPELTVTIFHVSEGMFSIYPLTEHVADSIARIQ